MKNGIRKFLEFIKKIMPLIIIIAIFLTIKFNPKWLTDFLGITDAQGGVSDLISYIELMIEFGFLYFVLKEFKMTRKNFEWQEEEQEKQKQEDMKRKLFYIYKTYFILILEEIALDNDIFSKIKENYIKNKNSSVLIDENNYFIFINKCGLKNLNKNVIRYFFQKNADIIFFISKLIEIESKYTDKEKTIKIMNLLEEQKKTLKYDDFVNTDMTNEFKRLFKNDKEIDDLLK